MERFKFSYLKSAADLSSVWAWARRLIDDLNKYPISAVSAHDELEGLADDDHEQYHTDARGDARYYPRADVDSAIAVVAAEVDAVEADIASLQAEDTALNLRIDEEGLPTGGSTGQVLAKASATNYDATWVDAPDGTPELPVGGGTGQVLAKASAADYDVEWIDAASGGGGGTGWTVIDDQTLSSVSLASIDYTDLGAYSEIMVLTRSVGKTGASTRLALRVSTDNGDTWYGTSGNYISLSNFGVETNWSGVPFGTLNNTPAYGGMVHLTNMNVTSSLKHIQNLQAVTDSNRGFLFVADTAPINAIRLQMLNTAANITGGTFVVLGR